jgi:hypothetical protein
MSGDDREGALRVLAKRQPFRSFLIELHSGDRILVSHPEAVDRYGRYGEVFLHRGPDRAHRIFAGTSVPQLIDPPLTLPGS